MSTGTDVARCRVCGCTEDRACPGGCHWVFDRTGQGDLCSSCAGEAEISDRIERAIAAVAEAKAMPGKFELTCALAVAGNRLEQAIDQRSRGQSSAREVGRLQGKVEAFAVALGWMQPYEDCDLLGAATLHQRALSALRSTK